jgi:hydroxylaminobenzene mutase
MNNDYQQELGNKLIRYGITLFLLGLLTGFVIPAFENPRMGLSSHLEGTLKGMVLILFGVIWPKLHLSPRLLKMSYAFSLFGTFANWATTLLAAIWGAGSEMMPLAGNDSYGSVWQEGIIKLGLISLSVSMIVVSAILLWGMRRRLPNAKS